MKTKLLILLLGGTLFTLLSFTDNNHYIDSLNGELSRAKNEIRQLHFKTEIAAAMNDKDTAVKMLETVLARAEELNHTQLELDANKALGDIYMSVQDVDNAVAYLSRAQFLAFQLHDTLNQAEAIIHLASIGSYQKKFKKSETLYHTAETLLQATGLPDSKYLQKLGLAYHQQAASFAQQEMLDSAQKLEEKSIVLFSKAGSHTDHAAGLSSLASYQSRQNDHEGAITSLNLALDVCTAEDAPMAATGFSQLALEYSAAGNLKMAQQKADSALLIARGTDAAHAKLAAYQALASVKEKINDYKQALHYYDSAAVLSAQLLSSQSAEKISFAQKKYTRQAETTLAEKEQEASLRISNIRMAGVGIFFLTALVFAFAVSRHKHGPTVTKVLGAIALLLTFELISLAGHPLMEKLTHHSALYMFLLLAVVAGVLVSLHHRIEDMVRKVFHTEG